MLPDPSAPTPAPHTTSSNGREQLSTPTRQSPIALAFIAWRFIRRLGIVNIGVALLFAVTGRFSTIVWSAATLAAIAITIFSIVSWYRFTFVVVNDELVVTRGVLSVERLVIPLDRVQSVSIDQRLLHRLVGLVRVSVDTAGSSQTEFEIAAIDVPTAEALVLMTSDARSVAAQPEGATGVGNEHRAPPDHLVAHRTFRELVIVGVTRVPWPGLAVLAPFAAFGDEIGDVVGLDVGIRRLMERGHDIGDGSTVALLVVLVGFVVIAAVAGAALQAVREVVSNWGLTVHRTPAGLRRTAGLVNRTTRSSSARRVQSLTTEDTPPQRWLGLTTLTLKVFGDNDICLPGARPADIGTLREIVFGNTAGPPLDRRISRWFVFIATRNAVAISIVTVLVLWPGYGWWSTVVVVAVPVRWMVARRQWRLRRWGLDDTGLAESYEVVTRHTTEVPLFKAQLVEVSQSFFERRRGLATVRVHTADGSMTVPLIEHAKAMAVRDRVVFAVETDRRPAF